jgi:hypothetical protein
LRNKNISENIIKNNINEIISKDIGKKEIYYQEDYNGGGKNYQ